MNQLKELQELQNIAAEEDLAASDLLESMFQTEGHTTKIIQSNQEAVDLIENCRPGKIQFDGWDTFSKISSGLDFPLLIQTNLATGDCYVYSIYLSSKDFLNKQLFLNWLEALAGSLNTNVSGSRTMQPANGINGNNHTRPPETSVVIPAYNEEDGLPLVLSAVFGVLDDSFEVLVIDDGSTDKTAEVASAFPCRLISHPTNMGKGAALRTGIQQARGKKVIFLDADNTYPVEAIPQISQSLNENEFVRGVRLSGRTNIPLVNRFGNQVFDSIIFMLHSVEGGDILSGMYGGHRDKLLELDLKSEGFDIEAEICVKTKARGLKCATIPITYAQRVGEKKLSAFYDGLRILYRVVQLAASFSPLLIFVFPGFLLLIMGLAGFTVECMEKFHILKLPFSINSSFLFGAAESLGAQLIVFGTAVYAAGMAYGLRGRANRSLDGIIRILSTRYSMLVGTILGVIGLLGIAWISFNWLIHQGPFTSTNSLIILSISTMIGVQLVSAGVFLSALKGLRKVNIDAHKKKASLRAPELAKE